MSCMLKAKVPKAKVHKKRRICGWAIRPFQLWAKPPASRRPRLAWRASCFHSEARFITATMTAQPCTSWINFCGLKSVKSRPNKVLLAIMPTSNML